MTDIKFPESERNFETRLIFIRDIFSNLHNKSDILASCVQHKLDRSLENYENHLHKSEFNLDGKDPLKVLEKIK